MKLAILFLTLVVSACGMTSEQELAAHLEAERDFTNHQYYLQQVAERKAFRPEVYANDEYLADCEYYQMEECYE